MRDQKAMITNAEHETDEDLGHSNYSDFISAFAEVDPN